MGTCLKTEGCSPIKIGGYDDHVHLLFNLSRKSSTSEVMQALKANSSRMLKDKGPGLREFSWQEGYAAFSVSPGEASRVIEYIATQEQHHRKKTFQEELLEMLNQAGMEYDEKYLWS
jgi:REP element-mobilizing transposase RayT